VNAMQTTSVSQIVLEAMERVQMEDLARAQARTEELLKAHVKGDVLEACKPIRPVLSIGIPIRGLLGQKTTNPLTAEYTVILDGKKAHIVHQGSDRFHEEAPRGYFAMHDRACPRAEKDLEHAASYLARRTGAVIVGMQIVDARRKKSATKRFVISTRTGDVVPVNRAKYDDTMVAIAERQHQLFTLDDD
jgi:hypothetical protein